MPSCFKEDSLLLEYRPWCDHHRTSRRCDIALPGDTISRHCIVQVVENLKVLDNHDTGVRIRQTN